MLIQLNHVFSTIYLNIKIYAQMFLPIVFLWFWEILTLTFIVLRIWFF